MNPSEDAPEARDENALRPILISAKTRITTSVAVVVTIVAAALKAHQFVAAKFDEIRAINIATTNALARVETLQRQGWQTQDQQNWTDEARRRNANVNWPDVNDIVRRRMAGEVHVTPIASAP